MIGGIESRGFVIATALALKFGKGMIMIRKAGKLPGQTIKKSYDIEYGMPVMEIQKDALNHDQRILIADDLIATGGTAIAAASGRRIGWQSCWFCNCNRIRQSHSMERTS